MGITGRFDAPAFTEVMAAIRAYAVEASIACGIHVVAPSRESLAARIAEGYRFLAHSIDAVFLTAATQDAHRPC